MNLIFMGPPGCGKGTQNKLFEEKYDLKPISTGDMFRSAISNKTEIGMKAKTFIDKGSLVPDEITIGIVKERLNKKDYNNGFILDGFPRTLAQAEAFDKLLKEINIKIDKVVFIDVTRDKIVKRLTGRKTCRKCNSVFNISAIGDINNCPSCKTGELYIRDDDKEEVIKKRLDTYDKETLPVRKFYENKKILFVVNGEEMPEKVFQKIDSKLNEK
jgi:adenylate kinase